MEAPKAEGTRMGRFKVIARCTRIFSFKRHQLTAATVFRLSWLGCELIVSLQNRVCCRQLDFHSKHVERVIIANPIIVSQKCVLVCEKMEKRVCCEIDYICRMRFARAHCQRHRHTGWQVQQKASTRPSSASLSNCRWRLCTRESIKAQENPNRAASSSMWLKWKKLLTRHRQVESIKSRFRHFQCLEFQKRKTP